MKRHGLSLSILLALLMRRLATSSAQSTLAFSPSLHSTAFQASKITRRRPPQQSTLLLQAAKPFASASLSSTGEPSSSFIKPQPETVAVIGGGIAGLTCAQFLAASAKFQPTVFDTGRLRPGGRCSSRQPGDVEAEDSSSPDQYQYLKSTIVDHAAQILTIPKGFPAFEKQVAQWEAAGVVTKYPEGKVCNIVDKKANGKKDDSHKDHKKLEGFSLRPLNTGNKPPMYYGSQGMGSIPLAIHEKSLADLQQDVWVAPSNGVRYQNESGKWKLQAKGQTLGIFDRLIIAHNGKCADRIMSKTPSKQIHSLLRVNFAPRVPSWGGKRMTLNSIYSLTFAIVTKGKGSESQQLLSVLDAALPADQFICGFVQNEPTIGFLSCQTRKYTATHGGDDDNNDDSSQDNNVQLWTVLSSAPFAKKHKAPQEFLTADVVKNVTQLLLQGVERSLCLPPNSVVDSIVESRLQLWGAAVPINVWDTTIKGNSEAKSESPEADGGFLYDSEYGVGVCGDWLLEPSIAGAWESGRRLAEYMMVSAANDEARQEDIVVGVKGSFRVSKQAMKTGIGSLTSSNRLTNVV